MEIKQAKVRGVESSGMLCSAKDLGLSQNHSGLLVLPVDAQLARTCAGCSIWMTAHHAQAHAQPRGLPEPAGIAREVSILTLHRLRCPS